MPHSSLFQMRFGWFSLNTCSVNNKLRLICRVLEKWILIIFAFTEERIFREPYSAIFAGGPSL